MYWLFSHTKTTGALHTAAMFSASSNFADVSGPVAEEADRQPATPAVLRRPRPHHRDRQMGADDDPVPIHHAVLDQDDHVIEPPLPPMSAPCLPTSSRSTGVHADATGERVVVAAVGAEVPVVAAHRRGEAGGHRLLPDPEVRRPAHQPRRNSSWVRCSKRRQASVVRWIARLRSRSRSPLDGPGPQRRKKSVI